MKLFLFRHAEASYEAPSDEVRELTQKGIQSIQKLAAQLKTKEFVNLAEIRYSELVRARQTAEVFQAAMELPVRLREVEGLRPEDKPQGVLEQLFEQSGDVMFVGHNPHLTMLASLLITGDPYADCIDFKKSGILCLDLMLPPSTTHITGAWAINWFIIPRIIKACYSSGH